MGDVRATGDMSHQQFIEAITEGDVGAIWVVAKWIEKVDGNVDEAVSKMMMSLDAKHLYGQRIWEAFSEECDGDIDRFIDHVRKLPHPPDTGNFPMF